MFETRLPIEELKKYLYPNLIAEIIESRYSICTLGDHKGLGKDCEQDAPEVLAKLRGDKEIMSDEAFKLSRLFDVKMEYLFSHELQVMSERPVAYWRWYELNKRREQEEKKNAMIWEIYRELNEKPHLLSFIKDMLTVSEAECLEVIRLLSDLRKGK